MARRFLAPLLAFSLISTAVAFPDDPPNPKSTPKVVTSPAEDPFFQYYSYYLPPQAARPDDTPKAESKPPTRTEADIKPLPPFAIPDDPPPHEGAMIDTPMIIEPPDIIVVQVLEALPGRPLSGEHLVRPDGMISLGYYGEVHVRGLTITQAKAKIALHLRKYIVDEVLGLRVPDIGREAPEMDPGDAPPATNRPMPSGRNPFDLDDPPAQEINPPPPMPRVPPSAQEKPAVEATGPDQPKAKTEDLKTDRAKRRKARRDRVNARAKSKSVDPFANPKPANPGPPATDDGQPKSPFSKTEEPDQQRAIPAPHDYYAFKPVEPEDTHRVYVDITGHNSRRYCVQGDVGVPGLLPFTGKETVLDALNYAGGLKSTAELSDIHLYRPASGGKPAKDYKIDLEAIWKGDAKANLQVFPNDRLVFGRNAIVKKTIEVDRANSLVNSMLNTILQYSFTTRTLGAINTPFSATGGSNLNVTVNGQKMPMPIADPTLMTPAQREAMLREWVDFLWTVSSREGGAMLDEKLFKDALMKKLTPAPDPK